MTAILIDIEKSRAELKLKTFETDEPARLFRGISKGTNLLRSKTDEALARGTYDIKTKSGMLRQSLSVLVRNLSGVVIGLMGSNLIYARIQEKGGKINVTRRMSKFAWYKFSETGDTMWKAIALKKGRQITIPAHFYMKQTARKNESGVLRVVMKEYIRGSK